MEHDGGGEHTQGDEQRQEHALTLGLPTLEDMGFAIGQRFAKGGFGELFYGVRLSRHHVMSTRAGKIFLALGISQEYRHRSRKRVRRDQGRVQVPTRMQ
jgi:hypothetical protein